MSVTDHVLRVVDLLNRFTIPYMLVGSYSSNFYGRPRLTQDADFVVELGEGQLAKLAEALGPEFYVDGQLGFGTITLSSRYVITHKASVFKIELFLLRDDAFSQSRFLRRRAVDFEGHEAWLPSPEDVIVQKLRWGRVQDVQDAAKVIAIQSGHLDFAYIRRWCGEHGTLGVLEETLKSIPPLPRG